MSAEMEGEIKAPGTGSSKEVHSELNEGMLGLVCGVDELRLLKYTLTQKTASCKLQEEGQGLVMLLVPFFQTDIITSLHLNTKS